MAGTAGAEPKVTAGPGAVINGSAGGSPGSSYSSGGAVDPVGQLGPQVGRCEHFDVGTERQHVDDDRLERVDPTRRLDPPEIVGDLTATHAQWLQATQHGSHPAAFRGDPDPGPAAFAEMTIDR